MGLGEATESKKEPSEQVKSSLGVVVHPWNGVVLPQCIHVGRIRVDPDPRVSEQNGNIAPVVPQILKCFSF